TETGCGFPTRRSGGPPDIARGGPGDHGGREDVRGRVGRGERVTRYAGRLAVDEDDLVLEGSNGSGTSALRRLSLRDVLRVHIARGPGDRIGDLPSLVLERRAGRPLRVSSLDRPGVLTELADTLSEPAARRPRAG